MPDLNRLRQMVRLPDRRAALRNGHAKPKSSSNGSKPKSVAGSELSEQRDQLSHEFVELQWDLGGMAYEMAARDHFRVDVLNRQAAKLQAVDSELAEVERLMLLEEGGAAGICPSCGAMHARAASFCWQCGGELIVGAAAAEGVERTTAETPKAPKPAAAKPTAAGKRKAGARRATAKPAAKRAKPKRKRTSPR